jgi:tetratricopeptide (TPR) repeat protein
MTNYLNRPIFLVISFTLVLFYGLIFSQRREPGEIEILADTLFKSMSIDELKLLQQDFQERVKRLQSEHQEVRGKGQKISESFIEREKSNIKDQDKILIKIAEYYIENSDDEYLKRAQEYEKVEKDYFEKLELYDQGKLSTEPVMPEFPKPDYSRALSVYDRILNEFPQGQHADDALYQKAFLIGKMGKGEESRRIFQEVIDRYPDSHFAAESYMSLAEYYFDPREDKDRDIAVEELQKAIKLYRKVLQYRDWKRYDEALYKLGWSYYKLTAEDPRYYSDAIVYFILVVDDITRAKKLDPNNKITNPDVRDEAIQYIGISFSDEETYAYAGVHRARRFIEKIGGRTYGVEVMRALGQTYQKIENNQQALRAYEALIDMYPFYEEAPMIKQKIGDTYFSLGQDAEQYRIRYELFKDYNPKSEWYDYIKNSELPDRVKYQNEAYALAERALFTNIGIDLKKAQDIETEGKDPAEYYAKVVNGSEEYLGVFAADSNSYEINWNYALVLDFKLKKYEEAYEQYVHVSNDYLETKYQEDAATNAISVAQTLVKIAFGDTSDTLKVIDVSEHESLRPEILGVEEKRLIEAYDNYIRLFPEGKNTPVFLSAAGAIYFNHRQFAEAKVYFNTLVKRFPGAREKSLAMRSIMNSYFALGKFRDSEFIAKRILADESMGEEEKIFAKERLAQAIFKNAKLYEDQGQYREAALEYRRLFEEVPDDRRYVDAGLFNAGLAYDHIKEWENALGTYTLLVDKYPDSKYTNDALRNAAEDHKELKQFADAGKIYERLFTLNRENRAIAEQSLYNASFYYSEGQDWTNAIRVNNQYIETYPEEELATDLYFANAGHYLKLDDVEQANRIYEEFAMRYPDDPRGVEAFYRRGDYYLEHDQLAAAKAEFVKAIDKSEQFNRQGKDPNRFYVGEALNSLVGMLRDEYTTIELKQPKSNIENQQVRMRTLITEIVNNNMKIIASGSIRSYEAAYNNAQIYEQFADIFVDQERNPNLNEVERFAENKRINEQSASLYQKAVEEYKKSVENIPLISEKLGIDMFAPDTTAPEPEVAEGEETDTTFVIKRAVKVDTTKQVAQKWYRKATDKISYLLNKQAEITSENVTEALATKNPQTESLPRLIYQFQVLSKIIAPAIQQTIEAHKHNLHEAEKLELRNKYTEESKRQILLTSNILAQELEKLAFNAITPYPEMSKEMIRLVESEYGTVNEKGQDYNIINTDIQQMIDLSKELANATLKNYVTTLERAREENIMSDLVRTTENRMLRFAVEFTDLYQVYLDSSIARKEKYEAKFQAAENYNYDDAAVFFGDHMFSLQDYSREILDFAFMLREDYQISNIWGNKLLVKLFKLDPATYGGSIEKEKITFESDSSWLFSTQYARGYINENFDDSSWQYAGIVPVVDNQFVQLGVNPPAMWIGTNRMTGISGAADTLQNMSISEAENVTEMDTAFTSLDSSSVDTSMALSDTVQIYFRKVINLEGTPVDGYIYITADDDFRFFFNGEYIIDDIEDDYSMVDSIDFATLSYFVKTGENLLVIHAVDLDKTAGGVKLYGYFDLLPADLTKAVEEKAMMKAIEVDPVLLKKMNTLNKNRISIKE